jgi:hypothetical protein
MADIDMQHQQWADLQSARTEVPLQPTPVRPGPNINDMVAEMLATGPQAPHPGIQQPPPMVRPYVERQVSSFLLISLKSALQHLPPLRQHLHQQRKWEQIKYMPLRRYPCQRQVPCHKHVVFILRYHLPVFDLGWLGNVQLRRCMHRRRTRVSRLGEP